MTAKTWKEPKFPSTEEWVKKIWYTYTMGYYSAIEKNETMPFAATRMDLEMIIGHTEKEKYHKILIIDTIFKTETDLTDLENKLMTIKGEGCREGIFGECGVDMYILLYLRQITNQQDLMYETGNSAQY